MATQTVVAVYGVPAGESRVQRLGSGIIPVPELVVVDSPLDAHLGSDHPPRVLRVGLGSRLDEKDPFVELREVARVLESVSLTGAHATTGTADAGGSGDRMWALELAEPARSPTIFGPNGPTAPDAHPFTAETLAELLRRHQPKRPELPHPPVPPLPPGRRPHPHPHGHPATLWCVLFPHASFCRQRA